MRYFELEKCVEILGGQVIFNPIQPKTQVCGVSIDSRKVQPGDLFFALPGQQVDGHAFVQAAIDKGACGAVVQNLPEGFLGLDSLKSGSASLIQVPAVLPALQRLAAWYRSQFTLPVIGVTGSSGKTTTKDLIAAVLSPGFRTLKTPGNYNNELGVPLTLFQLESTHQAAVLELAMRGRGEITALCQISQPTLGVLTNIGTAHQERLGSQANIAAAKGELIHCLPPEGWAVLNADDPWQEKIAQDFSGPIFRYGLTSAADISAENIQHQGIRGSSFTVRLPGEEFSVSLPLPGLHNVYNALAALGVGHLLGLNLSAMAVGLQKVQLSAMRQEICPGCKQSILINDTYNANPDSMAAALQVLSTLDGKRTIAVLGEMYELGAQSVKAHQQVGVCAAEMGVTLLVTVGDLAQEIAQGALEVGLNPQQVVSVRNKQEAIQVVLRELKSGDIVLVKGSRAMGMEEIIQGLKPQDAQKKINEGEQREHA